MLDERLRVLSEATRTLAEATVDYDRLIDAIARAASDVLPDACVLLVPSEGGRSLRPLAIHARDEHARKRLEALHASTTLAVDGPSTSAEVFRTGVPLLVPKVEGLEPSGHSAYIELLRALGVHSMLEVALRDQGRSRGVLAVVRYTAGSASYDATDLQLAQILGDHAALALAASRLITMRRRAEKRFARLSDVGALGVMVSDARGRVVEINDTLLRLLGYTPDELLSGAVPLDALTPPGFEAMDQRAYEELARTGVAALREKEYVRKGGSRVAVMVGTATLDAGGELISFVLDLTALRKAQETARAEQARFRALVEGSADGITQADEDGKFLYVSPAAARILGRPAEEVLGKSIRDYAHPDDLPTIVDQHRRLLDHESVPPTVRRVVRPDGSIRWIEVKVTNRLEAPVGAIVANIRDITERMLAEDARREAERRFKALFSSGVMGIFFGHADGAVRDANEAFLALVGFTREDVRAGRLNWKELTPPEWGDWNAQATADIHVHGRSVPREKEYFRKDGTRVPVLVGLVELDAHTRIAVVLDLSERKRAEREKAELEVQLRHAHKMEAVGRLAGGIAHDFNNMMSVILTYGEFLLADLGVDDPRRDDVEQMLGAGGRATDLTKRLLMFSRQQMMETKIIDVNTLVLGMHQMLRRVLGEDVELAVVTMDGIAAVLVDPSSLEQVMMNLVINARDAMPTGGKLTVETAGVVLDEEFARRHIGIDPGPYVKISVTDTGCGMDEATQARVFEPFFTTKEQGKGTGLGLSTVFGLVSQSGGTVVVRSQPERGSVFEVYLPRQDPEFDAAEDGAPASMRGGRETILLVEDDEYVRTTALLILQRGGYDVLARSDAHQALAICESREGPIHLLVTDVVMPGMGGAELAKRILAVRPETKVLCMSGYIDDRVVREDVLAADFAFIQKPITPVLLSRKVREVLDAPPRSAT